MSKPKPSGKHQVSMKLTMKDPYAKTGILSVRALRVSYDPSESINSNNSELFKDFYSHDKYFCPRPKDIYYTFEF